jgi:hypothetical protein
MCVTITVGDVDPRQPIWDRPQVAIRISSLLTTPQVLLQARAMLTYLGAPQTDHGVTCWCGDPVEIPDGSDTAAQYATALHGEMTHGA